MQIRVMFNPRAARPLYKFRRRSVVRANLTTTAYKAFEPWPRPASQRLFGTKRQQRARAGNSDDLIELNSNNHTKSQETRTWLPDQHVILPPPPLQSLVDGFRRHTTGNEQSIDASKLYQQNLHLPSLPSDWSRYEPATPLWHELAALIGVRGQPITTADYMELCLTHPSFGYYSNAQSKASASDDEWNDESDAYADDDDSTIIGPMGDFVTAPEVSQVFGECLAVWFMTQHHQEDTDWQWIELGPGRGSLMTDLLRFVSHVNIRNTAFGRGCRRIHFVEQSPVLRALQRDTLLHEMGEQFDFVMNDHNYTATAAPAQSRHDKPTIHVHWHKSFHEVQVWQEQHQSFLRSYVVGQEFIDALPVYAFEKDAAGVWRERLVDVAIQDDLLERDDQKRMQRSLQQLPDLLLPRLRLVLAPEPTPALKTLLPLDPKTNLLPAEVNGPAPQGSVVEVCPQGLLLVQDVAHLIQKQGGAALFVDYGQEGSTDSLRAFSRHEQKHFLSRPGEVDLTADVDFAALRHSVQQLALDNIDAFGPTEQGEFLMAMGVQDRVIQLMESDKTSEQQAEDLYEALVRLASPEEMGRRYKVLAIAEHRDAQKLPPGF